LRLNRDAADHGAFDVGYAPDSGSKADVAFRPSRAIAGLMRCSKRERHSIASSARAGRKFSDVELEGNPPGVILRAIDFRAPL
jgi:hypothetical protein